MNVHWPSVVCAAVVVVFALVTFPAPKGCGCAARKQKLRELGGRIFNG